MKILYVLIDENLCLKITIPNFLLDPRLQLMRFLMNPIIILLDLSMKGTLLYLRIINISTTAKSCKTSWGLTCTTTEQGITTPHWADG